MAYNRDFMRTELNKMTCNANLLLGFKQLGCTTLNDLAKVPLKNLINNHYVRKEWDSFMDIMYKLHMSMASERKK